MNIGQAAKAAGVSAKMVRHYEQIGLLKPAARTDAGYRQFDAADVEVLRFIRQARGVGFSIEQIGELLALRSNGRRSSRRVKALAQAHLDELDGKLRELLAMKAALEHLIDACAGDDGPACGILDGLARGAAAARAPAASAS